MQPLTIRPDRLQRLRELCLALPEATEKIAWGDPTWRVRDKIFAMQKGNYEGGRPSLWLKAPDGAQAALVQGQRDRFFVPPYVGHKGWVGVYLDGRAPDWPLLESLIEESYRLIAPKRLAAALSTAGGGQEARGTAGEGAVKRGGGGRRGGAAKRSAGAKGRAGAKRGAAQTAAAREESDERAAPTRNKKRRPRKQPPPRPERWRRAPPSGLRRAFSTAPPRWNTPPPARG